VKKLSNDRDLLLAQLSELLWVERRLAFDVLKDVIDAVHDSDLRGLFQTHLEETREHVRRVEQAFRELGVEPSSALSPGFSGLIEQHDTVAKKIVSSEVEDRWHAAAGIAAEHFELALYSAIESAPPDAVRSALTRNVEDEESALGQLERWLRA
jgi:ferritin-like metal-binding protein YciE